MALGFGFLGVGFPRDDDAPVDLVESKTKQSAKLADAGDGETRLLRWTWSLHWKQFKSVEGADLLEWIRTGFRSPQSLSNQNWFELVVCVPDVAENRSNL